MAGFGQVSTRKDSSSHGGFYESHGPDAAYGRGLALKGRGTCCLRMLPHGQNSPYIDAASQSLNDDLWCM